jgi:hypothetical protein
MLNRGLTAFAALGLVFVCGTAGSRAADDVSTARVATFGISSMASDLITATPQLECLFVDSAPGVCSYHVIGTPKSWAGRPRDPIGGILANGQPAYLTTLQSAGNGRGHVFMALVWTRVDGHVRFVGYIPALDGGDISIGIGDGVLVVTTSVYGPDDMDCCPKHVRIERDTLDGVVLKKISTSTVPLTEWPGDQWAVPTKI